MDYYFYFLPLTGQKQDRKYCQPCAIKFLSTERFFCFTYPKDHVELSLVFSSCDARQEMDSKKSVILSLFTLITSTHAPCLALPCLALPFLSLPRLQVLPAHIDFNCYCNCVFGFRQLRGSVFGSYVCKKLISACFFQ